MFYGLNYWGEATTDINDVVETREGTRKMYYRHGPGAWEVHAYRGTAVVHHSCLEADVPPAIRRAVGA